MPKGAKIKAAMQSDSTKTGADRLKMSGASGLIRVLESKDRLKEHQRESQRFRQLVRDTPVGWHENMRKHSSELDEQAFRSAKQFRELRLARGRQQAAVKAKRGF